MILQPWEDEESSLPRDEDKKIRSAFSFLIWKSNRTKTWFSILFCSIWTFHPFWDFDVNAIDMLGLKAQAIQEGVQYAFGVFQSESPAKIFIRGKKKMFCWPSFLYRRKFISNFSRVAEGYCSGVTDPVKPFWQAELKQLWRHISQPLLAPQSEEWIFGSCWQMIIIP